jgi:hypothetical protein
MQPQKKQIITQPFEVRSRLEELGVTEEILRLAVEEAIAGFNSCTDNHPRTHAGSRFWADGIRSLRDSLTVLRFERVESGKEWHAEEDNNLPLVVNKAGTVAITVATGDKSTGKEHETPCTNSAKGPRTKDAVNVNEAQYLLIPDLHLTPEDLEKFEKMGRMTFLLLMHRDAQSLEVRCELSRPRTMDKCNRVNGWIERIILKSLPFTGERVDILPEVPQTPEIDVKVKKRA